MSDQDSGCENKDEESVLQVRIRFFRLLPYIAAYMIMIALIASFVFSHDFVFANYVAWIWFGCIVLIPILTAWESNFLVIDLLEHGIRVRRLWWTYEVENGTCFRFSPMWFAPFIDCDDRNFNLYSRSHVPKPSIVDHQQSVCACFEKTQPKKAGPVKGPALIFQADCKR